MLLLFARGGTATLKILPSVRGCEHVSDCLLAVTPAEQKRCDSYGAKSVLTVDQLQANLIATINYE